MGKKWRRMEQEFLDEHLGKWAIKLCRQVMEQSTEPFYRDFAALAATFLHMEAGAFQPK
jgi:TorA maturation chaperone TorD